jgi:hypothetical protein
MAYGFEVTGSDSSGSYLVTDSSLDLVNYQVVATGNANSVDIGSAGQYPILMINANLSGLTGKGISCTNSGTVRNFKVYEIATDGQGNKSFSSSANASVDYVLLKDMTGITAASGAGDYGIQVLTAAGAVAFDSRRLLTNTSLLFTSVLGPGTKAGTNSSLSTDPDEYVSTAFFFSLDNTGAETFAGVIFNPSGSLTGIRFQNWINIDIDGVSSDTFHFSNFTTIMLGNRTDH